MTKVTYSPPNEPGFPAVNLWNGVEFPANVPVELDPVKHSYSVIEVEKWVDEATGLIRSRGVERRKSMIEIAKGHPHFVVEGEALLPQRPQRGRPRLPKTSEEYRSHAMSWISSAEHMDDLERWNEEEDLRARCGCGDEDIGYLKPFFDAKHHELSKQR